MDEKKKDYKTAQAAASIVILVIAILLWRLFDMGFAVFIAAGAVFAISRLGLMSIKHTT